LLTTRQFQAICATNVPAVGRLLIALPAGIVLLNAVVTHRWGLTHRFSTAVQHGFQDHVATNNVSANSPARPRVVSFVFIAFLLYIFGGRAPSFVNRRFDLLSPRVRARDSVWPPLISKGLLYSFAARDVGCVTDMPPA
jgi:hypothetical protein